ncbi:hypothetical protein KKH27_14610 [bacterium]|nr:hypothetical protein [bacterium]MBU1984588.1 hypothetical protein [bacterium]
MHLSARSLLVPFCLFLALILMIGCDTDNDNNSDTPPSTEHVWVVLGDDSVQMMLRDLPKITVEGEEAIRLNEFVTTTLVPNLVVNDTVFYDYRALYGYRIVGEDGFSAHDNRGYADNIWAHFHLGYMLVSNRRAIFPDDSIDLAGAYNVTGMRFIRLYRKFDVQIPDTTSFVELNDVTPVTVTNPDGEPESALPLSDFVTLIVTAPENFQYNLRSLDDFGPTTNMTWAQFQTGYWLLTSQRTMFNDTTLIGGRYRLRHLESIQVLP